LILLSVLSFLYFIILGTSRSLQILLREAKYLYDEGEEGKGGGKRGK